MLGSSVISRNCLRKAGVGDLWLNSIFREINQRARIKNVHSASFCNKKLTSWSSQCFSSRRLGNIGISSKYSSAKVEVLNQENDVQRKSSFRELLHARKVQAHRSVLVEVTEKESIPFAIGYCEKYDGIESVYSYPGEHKNYFLLLEFSNESSVQKLLENCRYGNIDHSINIHSRIIRYMKGSNAKLPKVNLTIHEESSPESSFKRAVSVSEVIQHIYSTEKLTELDTKLRFFLCSLLKDSLSGYFPHCDLLPFGSSVNGIGRRGCDLDIVIRLYPEKINGDGEVFFVNKPCVGSHKTLQQRTLSRIGESFLLLPGVTLSDRVMFARVPILKMKHSHLKLDFDVSVNNMSAVLMSDMVQFCGAIDPRVLPLMYVVKKWAKEANITMNFPGSQITNFGLINLVLYFLQTRPQPILPPLNDAVKILGSENSYDFQLEYSEPIEYWKTGASLNKESLAVLLKEFLLFLSSFNFHGGNISLLGGKTRHREEDSTPMYIEYPMDESLNIVKNVSKSEYDALCEKARISAKHLEHNLNQKVNTMQDFSALLAIPSLVRIGSRPQKFDVNSVMGEGKFKNRKHRIT